MTLSRAQILAAADRPTTTVDVPEWGGEVKLRGLKIADVIRFQDMRGNATPAQTCVWLVAVSAVDDSGAPIFDESDLAALGEKAPAALDRIARQVLALNRMRAEDDEARVKNS